MNINLIISYQLKKGDLLGTKICVWQFNRAQETYRTALMYHNHKHMKHEEQEEQRAIKETYSEQC